MRILILILFFSNTLFCQEVKFKVLNQKKISDSLIKETASLMVYNWMENPICLRVSTTFGGKILSRDTIELGGFKMDDGCLYYDLWVTKEDRKQEYNVNYSPRFPLILYPRSCFATTISYIRDLRCSWIEFSYTRQPEINYNELFIKYINHQAWDIDPNLKFLTKKIEF